LIKKNPQLRRKAVFRNDVAYGMRPVKFSFSPSVAVEKRTPSQASLLGTGPLNEQQGLIAPSDSTTTYARNPASAIGYRYRKAGWMQMVMPAFSAASHNTGQGAGYGSGNSPLVIYDTTTASFADQIDRWAKVPLFGMYMGLMPGTAEVWPKQLLQQVSYELEFKGLRNYQVDVADIKAEAFRKGETVTNSQILDRIGKKVEEKKNTQAAQAAKTSLKPFEDRAGGPITSATFDSFAKKVRNGDVKNVKPTDLDRIKRLVDTSEGNL